MWKKAAVAYIKILSLYSIGESEEDHGNFVGVADNPGLEWNRAPPEYKFGVLPPDNCGVLLKVVLHPSLACC